MHLPIRWYSRERLPHRDRILPCVLLFPVRYLQPFLDVLARSYMYNRSPSVFTLLAISILFLGLSLICNLIMYVFRRAGCQCINVCLTLRIILPVLGCVLNKGTLSFTIRVHHIFLSGDKGYLYYPPFWRLNFSLGEKRGLGAYNGTPFSTRPETKSVYFFHLYREKNFSPSFGGEKKVFLYNTDS